MSSNLSGERKNRQKLIIITGPTASGKTALALKLAKKFRGEIVSADSRQVYRGMDIGTAKDSRPHHLVNIRNPNQSYTLAHFLREAKKIIRQIQNRGHTPFLVGGTAHYIHALVNNLMIPEVKPNAALRKKLEKLSTARLFEILKNKDLRRAKTIDPRNKRRLIRALEIIQSLGKVPSLLQKERRGKFSPSFLILAPKISDLALRHAIKQRTEAMLRAGLVKEVKKLVKKYGRRSLFLSTIGYREVIEYLEGDSTLTQTKSDINTHTYQYTRRQLTWLRRLPAHWISNQTVAEKKVKLFLLSK